MRKKEIKKRAENIFFFPPSFAFYIQSIKSSGRQENDMGGV